MFFKGETEHYLLAGQDIAEEDLLYILGLDLGDTLDSTLGEG